ncbi:MAG TPA: ABC transporter permease subunit [Opitutaceae bacterium]|nr:ABC transporter permease subunit [Opitutaceae bacterium]
MNATGPSSTRLAVIAVNTFRESVRARFFMLVSLLAAALGIGAWWFRNCSLGAPPAKFLLDAGFGALTFFGAVVAIVAAAESFSGEIERRTVLAVLARPVRRGEFVLGKLGGILVLLLAFCGAGTGLLVGLLRWQEATAGDSLAGAFAGAGRVSSLAVMACGLVQWLRCSVLAALTLVVSSYARSSLLAVTSGFAALVVCSLRSLAWDSLRVAGPEWARDVAGLVGLMVPDFELYDVADGVAGGGALSAGYLGGIMLYSAAYVSLFVALAVFCFRHREL